MRHNVTYVYSREYKNTDLHFNLCPTLPTSLKGFVTTRTLVVPGKLAIPAPGVYVLLATLMELSTVWNGTATREDAWLEQGVITVNNFQMIYFHHFQT